ncbi:FAD-binding oxidoreductase [Insolitispirillum peregrinum]|uniref:FAD-binding oxidoreductase n=1 Tax=Insolitispirillum peregrinum TaxID=80876 RepID=UPI00361FAC45
MAVTDAFLSTLRSLVGDKAVLTDASDREPYLTEERGLYRGKAPVVVRPANTAEVAAVVKACADAGISIVPQGGNTGLCGGAVSADTQVILSLGRMNKVRGVDPINFTMTVDAGCILQDLQAEADKMGCYFPLALGAQGTCQIGGNLSTNAGGINVLRYGNTRDLCLGLEVVLPDGRVWDGLRALGKDNTGYALKHLFIGGEGTLGIITGAVLKVYPGLAERQTALLAVDDINAVTALLAKARSWSGDAVTAFELVSRFAFELACRHLSGVHDPFEEAHPWYVLVEFSTSRPNADLRGLFESFLEAAFEDGIIVDGIVAESLEQTKQLWHMREGIPEAQKHEGASIKHDVAVPVSSVPEFLTRALAAVCERLPGLRPCPFGHVGDGNIHFNLTQPEGMDKDEYLALWEDMNRIVHDIVVEMKGSISAEHGVGQLKVEEIIHYKDAVEIDLMRTLKVAMDPKGIMNPGKVVNPQ